MVLVSGDNSSRKTGLSMYMADYLARERGQKFDPINHIYYTTIDGLVDELLTKWQQIRIVDEGYFGGTNLESNLPKVLELNSAVNAVRNRGHVIFFIYSKINRATKMLLEVANYWMHKPHPDYALFNIRDREFVGNDPWGIDKLLKAERPAAKRYLMTHTASYLTTLKVPWVKDKLFNAYDDEKKRKQEEYQLGKMKTRENSVRQQRILEEIKADYHGGAFTIDRTKEYLATKGFTPSLIRKYTSMFRDNIIEEAMDSKIKDRLKEDIVEDAIK